VRGDEHRLLVVGGRLVAAARGETAWVTGDGRATVAQLIDDQLNSDPRRGSTEDYPLNVIRVDEDAAVGLELKRQGIGADSIPAQGRRILIQRNGNVAIDVTDRVHPGVAATVALAARVVGLDIAGIDLVAEDIARPLAEQGGAIVEVNAGPGLLMHLKPAEGTPQPVGRAIVDHLFPNDNDGRIPIVGIAGSRGRTAVARLLAALLQLSGKSTSLACGDGSFVGQRRVDKRNGANWQGAHRALINRAVEAAVIETEARSIVAEGLAYDRCQVAVITNIDPTERIADHYIETPEQLVNVLRTLVDVVLAEGVAVLNAADPLVAPLASLCDGEVVFFAADGNHAAITEQRARGRRAVFARDGALLLAHGDSETPLPGLLSLPGAAGQPDNLLAAAAAAWALDISPELILAGIKTHFTERNAAQAGDNPLPKTRPARAVTPDNRLQD
jgi:cyanophycin synthetase